MEESVLTKIREVEESTEDLLEEARSEGEHIIHEARIRAEETIKSAKEDVAKMIERKVRFAEKHVVPPKPTKFKFNINNAVKYVLEGVLKG